MLPMILGSRPDQRYARQVDCKFTFGWVTNGILKLQAKWLMVCMRYIDAMDWRLVPTLGGADLKVVDTLRVKHCCCFYDTDFGIATCFHPKGKII